MKAHTKRVWIKGMREAKLNPKVKTKWRDDGLTNHERVVKQRGERKKRLEMLKQQELDEEIKEVQ